MLHPCSERAEVSGNQYPQEQPSGVPLGLHLAAHDGDFNTPFTGFLVLPVSLAPLLLLTPAAVFQRNYYSQAPVFGVFKGDPN